MGIVEALAGIEERIHAACARSGRNPAEVQLMGVTKFHSRALVEEAWNAGLRLFGESRVQEAARKFSGFRADHLEGELHLIGSLQRNKVKAALALFDCVQSVDRAELIAELGAAGKPVSILLELNAGEASKSGYAGLEELFSAAEQALSYPSLRLRGLMTIAPFTSEDAPVRRAFRNLRAARDKLRSRFPGDWSVLSMGMSGDFETAIEEGSTLIRIGTALFGERTAP